MIFITAFIFGLISSLHCIGMCGPIALMLPLSKTNSKLKVIQLLLYNGGRIISYGIIGFAFGWIGRGLSLAGFQQNLSIVMGVLMILWAIIPEKAWMKYTYTGRVVRLLGNIKSSMGNQLKKNSWDAFFTLGLLNGFLPCGMVYAALFGAIAMGNVQSSVLYMMFYGLGTLPLMSIIALLSQWISTSIRTKIQRLIPLFVIALGVIFILRGLDLGIQNLSPSQINLMIQANPDCY